MNEELYLIAPSLEYEEEILSYRQEFLAAGGKEQGGFGTLLTVDSAAQWIQDAKDALSESACREGYVPASQYICVRESDKKIVGTIQIRHYLNDYLAQYGGHIGYSVRPSERKKGYATWMLANSLPLCRSLNLDKVLITCKNDNEGSRRVIKNNNGVYEQTVYNPNQNVYMEKYWISL